ncbi:hypothetical protein [Sulfurimonas sp.]
MNEPITLKNSDNKVQRSLKKLYIRRDTILLLLDKAVWLDIEKREVIKMMVDIFMDFAGELSKKKGWK